MNYGLRPLGLRTQRGLVSLLTLFAIATMAAAASAVDVVRVEEDWELVVGEPDANSAGPQIACTMSPFTNISDTHFTLEINHRSMPWWSPGGISIHQWSGEWRQQSIDRADRAIMQTNDEVVRWTQALYVQDGGLNFQVKDGTSTTWGAFGYSSMFKLRTNWGVSNINSYSPDVSAALSGVAYAGNRVKLLRLVQVRATLAGGAVVTDSTVRVVHQLPSP
jgi:hypothetical protein